MAYKTDIPSTVDLARIEQKYPHIKVIPGEDLNIHRMVVNTIKSRLLNTKKYLTTEDVWMSLGISERTMYKIMRDNSIESRKDALLRKVREERELRQQIKTRKKELRIEKGKATIKDKN